MFPFEYLLAVALLTLAAGPRSQPAYLLPAQQPAPLDCAQRSPCGASSPPLFLYSTMRRADPHELWAGCACFMSGRLPTTPS